MNNYKKTPGRKTNFLQKAKERKHLVADTVASVALIILCCGVLLYLLMHPEIPKGMKDWVNDHWDELRDILTFRNYPIQGFFQQTWGRKFSTIIGDMLVLVILFPIFQILLVISWPLQLLLPSVVRITPYALPIFIIIGQVSNILFAGKHGSGRGKDR